MNPKKRFSPVDNKQPRKKHHKDNFSKYFHGNIAGSIMNNSSDRFVICFSNYGAELFAIPELLTLVLVHVDVPDFSLAAVSKLWASIFQKPSFWKQFCSNHWNVNIDDNILTNSDIRKYIFDRFNMENLSLRMLCVLQTYHHSREEHYLTVLRSLISQEEFICETKGRILDWLAKLEPIEDKITLTNLLNRLFYEDYDKYVSQDGGAWFGEGWNGSYRIYNNKGSFITVNFHCYCHPGHEKELLKLFYTIYKDSEKHKILEADARGDEITDYIYNSANVYKLRAYMDLETVSLTHLFCFLLYSMGKLLELNGFQSLGTDQFSEFWQNLEKLEHEGKIHNSETISEDKLMLEMF